MYFAYTALERNGQIACTYTGVASRSSHHLQAQRGMQLRHAWLGSYVMT